MNKMDPSKRTLEFSNFINTLKVIEKDEFWNLSPGTLIFHRDSNDIQCVDQFVRIIPTYTINSDVIYHLEYVNINGDAFIRDLSGWYYYRKPLPIIDCFIDEYSWLSNFHTHRTIWINDWAANTAEHLYQAHKATGSLEAHRILKCDNPRFAKYVGNEIPLRNDWQSIKLQVMENVLRKKFEIPELRKKLIATDGQILIEGNWWKDRYWGVYDGTGLNMLGELLMKIRTELTGNSVIFNKSNVYGAIYKRKPNR